MNISYQKSIEIQILNAKFHLQIKIRMGQQFLLQQSYLEAQLNEYDSIILIVVNNFSLIVTLL